MKAALIFVICVIFLLATSTVFAQGAQQTMQSTQYRVKYGNINFGSGNGVSDNYGLGSTEGQLAAQEFASAGYIVKAGFQYLHSIIPFSFSISDSSIALGTLAPGVPTTAITNLSVAFGGAGQYQVTAEELGTLRTSGGSSIADTVCNGGAQTCSESSSNVWNSASAYGFGYNMSGDGVPGDFTDATYFRPFPDALLAESPQVVMSSVNVTKQDDATMTFKTNISAIQEAGSYHTIIRFIATPSF